MSQHVAGKGSTHVYPTASPLTNDHPFVHQFFTFSHGIEQQKNDRKIIDLLVALSTSYTFEPFTTIHGSIPGQSWPSLIPINHSSASTESPAAENTSLLVYLQTKELETRIHNVTHISPGHSESSAPRKMTMTRSVSAGSFLTPQPTQRMSLDEKNDTLGHFIDFMQKRRQLPQTQDDTKK